MNPGSDSIYEALEKIFHEPNRLAIMSALCGAREGLVFNELKTLCRLTDGNLNRHLKVLDEAGAVRIEKAFVGSKPQTTISISSGGLRKFNEYLQALGEVLKKAKMSMPAESSRPAVMHEGRAVRI
jgi:DNA-binding transcriptional ArsR family regulator